MSIPGRKAQRRPIVWAALLAVLGLLAQGLIPGAAMAHEQVAAGVVVCTATGTKVVPAGDTAPAKGFAGLPCQHCVAASLAMVDVAPPAVPVSVTYAAAVSHEPGPATVGTLGARAPPRPPSQAPPAFRS